MFGLKQKPGVGFFKDENCSVVLLCHSSLIEVVVHEGNVRSQKDDLQANLGNSHGYRSDSFEVLAKFTDSSFCCLSACVMSFHG